MVCYGCGGTFTDSVIEDHLGFLLQECGTNMKGFGEGLGERC